MYKLIIFILIFVLDSVYPARILFFFAGGTYSHEISVAPLVKKLSAEHNITFLSAHKKKPFKLANVEIIVPQALMDLQTEGYSVERVNARLNHEEMQIWQEKPIASVKICEILLNSDDVVLQNLFRTRQFDLVFIDAVACDCGFIATYIFKAKAILYDPTTVLPWHYDIYQLPKESAWVPQLTVGPTYPMGFYDRMVNYYDTFYWTAFRRLKMYPAFEIILKKFLGHNDFPSFIELERNISLVFLNTHYSTDFARALPPWFIHIGGLQCWETDGTIPINILSFMDKSKKVVVIAFGSSVDMDNMPKHILSMFMESIRELKDVSFIWKWNGKIPEDAPKNVLFVDWLPQNEILGHKKTVGFITHCGLNGIMEATHHAVPVIAFPLFSGQDTNAYRIQSENIGIKLEFRDLTKNKFLNATREILSNKLYKNNMEKFSRAFRDRPMTPMDTALYWTKYVLTHDDLSPLKPKLGHLSFIELHQFDLILTIFAIAMLAILTLLAILKCLISHVTAISASEKKPTKKKTVPKKKYN